jgi:hypothetical protein
MKKSKMKKQALKDIIYGSLRELADNKELYYYSSVSSDYSQFTEEGIKAMNELVTLLCYQIIKTEDMILKEKSKEMLMNDLKGDKV